jgi:hypothetical protein
VFFGGRLSGSVASTSKSDRTIVTDETDRTFSKRSERMASAAFQAIHLGNMKDRVCEEAFYVLDKWRATIPAGGRRPGPTGPAVPAFLGDRPVHPGRGWPLRPQQVVASGTAGPAERTAGFPFSHSGLRLGPITCLGGMK